ncbi:MAG TPA: hypothetical protein VMV49_01325 [Candidatus Deferrimicrobium sp.]|nr:hypothetical protein [Candidatus Deferrimicrobium sp.]
MELKDIKGIPPFKPGRKLGYFLWEEEDGLHLMWSTTGDLHYFRGTITGDKKINIKKLVKLESNDEVQQASSKMIQWETRTQADGDGVIFEAEADFTLDLSLDNNKIGFNFIYCGISMRHPTSNPFTIKKEKP